MNKKMLASFYDELQKIAANAVVAPGGSGVGKPASLSAGANVGDIMKPSTKHTDYSVVNNEPRPAVSDTAAGSKAVPPPPVRT